MLTPPWPIGETFHAWTVIDFAPWQGQGKRVNCVCVCGKRHVHKVCDIKAGRISKGCGCTTKRDTGRRFAVLSHAFERQVSGASRPKTTLVSVNASSTMAVCAITPSPSPGEPADHGPAGRSRPAHGTSEG